MPLDYAALAIDHSPLDEHKLWKGKKRMKPMSGVDALPRRMPVKAKSGIYIKPENRGKFIATQKTTGKSTAELKHSSNPVTRKRANFAMMAKRHWKPL